MKKKILYIATLMLATSIGANAQSVTEPTAMRLTFNDKLTIAPEGLSEASPEGTVGTLDGVEAIVVDLGGNIGKVAIATKNYGADSETDRGYGFGYDNAMLVPGTISGTYYDFGEGWYLPSKTELDALLNRLTWNSTKKGAEIDFGETSLFLPASGYRSNGTWYAEGSKCVYWSSTANGSEVYRIDMSSTSKSMMSGNKTTGTPLRTFHALAKAENYTAPIEREHNLQLSSIAPSADGKGITLTVDGASVTYPYGLLKEMTFFDGTPTVNVKANQDPDNAGNYYTTFYSGLEAYQIPDGVTAYTAVLNGDVAELTAITDGILPKGEAVLLYSNTLSNIAMQTTDMAGSPSGSNEFCGVDVSTKQTDTNYMLSYGQNGLAFYKMGASLPLAPNKAYIAALPSVKAIHFIFSDDDVTSAESAVEEEVTVKPVEIYTIDGIRQNRLQQGINIVNGKKVYVK